MRLQTKIGEIWRMDVEGGSQGVQGGVELEHIELRVSPSADGTRWGVDAEEVRSLV